MSFDPLSLLAHGLVPLPWWGYVVVALVFTHITIAAVTIYLHRSQAHRGLDLHPLVSHFFRFWLWLTTGMVTKEWVAIHRKHHAKVETAEDPHSPQTRGINKVFWEGAELYRDEAKSHDTLDKYGLGTPDDWIERNVYTRHSWEGVGLMLVVNLALFGPLGATIWAVQMAWIPVTAAGIINGIGHYWGYRNFSCEDASRNIVPWGILIGGEELHNNHHAYGTSAKLSSRWYEFDLGWAYIRTLEFFGLATVRKVAPRLKFDRVKLNADLETLQAIITHRYAVLTSYASSLKLAYAQEVRSLRERARRGELTPDMPSFRRLRKWFQSDAMALPETDRARLETTLEVSSALKTIYAMRQELAGLWERSNDSREQLLARLQDWCHRAEASNIAALQKFSRTLRSYA
ncbi:MAG TPA: fatty acid desaturase [Casimicrobiaceae bacterium]|jgi:stearoyl-CoA desaturase (delta-9 desaturase)|nr:fatty acid desaturase [Casimicrobiaceae bacterium]